MDVPLLPTVAQELRTHLNGHRAGFVFESNRLRPYTTRYVYRTAQRRRVDGATGIPNPAAIRGQIAIAEPADTIAHVMITSYHRFRNIGLRSGSVLSHLRILSHKSKGATEPDHSTGRRNRRKTQFATCVP